VSCLKRRCRCCLPLRETGSAASRPIDFGATPFTCVAACYLPVYASEQLFPPTYERAVRVLRKTRFPAAG